MEKDLTDVPFRLRYHRVMEMIDEALDSVHITQKQILKGSGLGEGKANPIKWGGGDNASGPSSSRRSIVEQLLLRMGSDGTIKKH
ncbi:Protein of unknown function [Gryllus bimaculatus]|nr:Protein of unknown function [Gryllus bimaculatus]